MGRKIRNCILYLLFGIPVMIIYFNIINPILALTKRERSKDEMLYAKIFGIYSLLMVLFFFLVPVVGFIMLILEYIIIAVAMIYTEITEKEKTGLGERAPQNERPGAGGIFAGLDVLSAKKLFRTLVKKYHPDTGHGDNEAMKEIVREYEAYKGNIK